MPEKDRGPRGRGTKPGAEEGEGRNDYRSNRLPTQAARSFARSAAILLTRSACILTWCGFTAWRSARKARGREHPIQPRVRTDKFGRERATERVLSRRTGR
jgi:hypothetical protein